MTQISRLKYIQWRPIGVCDAGVGKQRKAKIFSKPDFVSITSPEINRGNWRKNSKVIEIIKIYGKNVAEISTLTDGMVNPEIYDIKLVGAVIEYEQTPLLNQESMDGKVQFFQVSFKDGGNQKASKIRWKNWFKRVAYCFVIIMSIILLYFTYTFFSDYSLKKVHKYNPQCSANRKNKSYLEELKDIRKSLISELSSLPEWLKLKESRLQCTGSSMDVNNQEKILLDCYITVRKNTKKIIYTAQPSFNRIESCAISLCKRNLKHLASKCERM